MLLDEAMPTSIPHAQPEPRSESEPSEPRALGNARRIGTWLLSAALCLPLGYLGGLMHGTLRAQPAEQRLEAALVDADRKLHSAREQAASERSARAEQEALVSLYEAYRATVQALSALDARNFGIAETRLRASGAKLQELAEARPRLKGLQSLVAQTSVKVADDLAVQRSVLLELVAKLDEQIGMTRTDMKLSDSLGAAERPRE